MAHKDAGHDTGIGDAPVSGAAPNDPPVLTAEERVVLEALVACKTSRTATQLSTKCGMAREDVAIALEGLRAKGLATRFNTLVESYAARFPGIQV